MHSGPDGEFLADLAVRSRPGDALLADLAVHSDPGDALLADRLSSGTADPARGFPHDLTAAAAAENGLPADRPVFPGPEGGCPAGDVPGNGFLPGFPELPDPGDDSAVDAYSSWSVHSEADRLPQSSFSAAPQELPLPFPVSPAYSLLLTYSP